MSPVTISCPQCSAGLKLPNRSLLGRKGKCPKCQHRFILEEPDEVELQLAEPEATTAVPAEAMVGTSAKWIPDHENVSGGLPVLPAAPAVPSPQTLEAAPNFHEPETQSSAAAVQSASGSETGALNFAAGADAADSSVVNRVRQRQKTKSRLGPIVIGIGTALFAFSMFGLWWQQNSQAKISAEQAAVAQPTQKNDAWEAEKEGLATANEEAKTLSPTSGKNIPLDYMPFTPHLICHLRPAELWGPESRNQEFVAMLGVNFGGWLGDVIRTITRFEPQEIEELTFAVNFGSRTSIPDVAAVVRLRSEQSASDLQLKRFRGQVRADLNAQVFESDDYSYMLIDTKTFVVAPNTMSDSLADSKSYSRQASVDIEVLLKESDRQRHVTLMFDTINIDTHREYIFQEEMQTFADKFVLWFGKDIQTVSWSMHLGDDFFMETLLHENNESSPLRVQRHIKLRMQELPRQLQSAARFMKPPTLGYKEMIGRFPAMMRATFLGTTTHVGPSYVRLITLLPGKAAANLAAASLFTWDQSVNTDFTGPAPVAAGPALPDKIVDRLQIPIIVDFRRTPLQEVFEYISDEIKTPIIINGDGLKLAGMTQNMPQTYNLGETAALKAVHAIVSNPDYKGALVIVVDETAKNITVTSRAAAEKDGLAIFDTSQ